MTKLKNHKIILRIQQNYIKIHRKSWQIYYNLAKILINYCFKENF